MPISRRKNFKYKENKVVKPPKTGRTELTVVERAFAVGAITGLRGGYASVGDLANAMGRTTTALSNLINRVEKKRANIDGFLWDSILYNNELGRGRPTLLSQDQKDHIIRIVTSSQENREKEPWQAVRRGDFNEVIPKMSIETFQNVMYEAGYARRKPGWKPSLTTEQEEERLEWALAHNPDLHKEYDNLGYDFTKVVFTDETPARIGEERGMIRTWCTAEEKWDNNVKHDRNTKNCCLQFYASFRYNHKGPCHVYYPETKAEKELAAAHIKRLNQDQKTRDNKLQIQARRALNHLEEADINRRYNTRKKHVHMEESMDTDIVKVPSRRLSHGSIHSKRRGYLVYYNRMGLLLTRHVFLTITLLLRILKDCGGQATHPRSTQLSMPGHGFDGM
ncbi:hypothetical protein BU25DRAFT_469715 [Macroventuria anomochaeta]|uniref:Uncharacterized protein n=1 Tax=Macroventuria anomochaeta TaxID=301207 RepID=A0ACB6RZU8_9PLEO|nr:uncharacterized protein BU25DRAFT_469715 [Macroventuria anomochaeta]KAF2627242.1 hypothetical protein BU25DRAFT_469715 [Macroventuria anomochaeta]